MSEAKIDSSSLFRDGFSLVLSMPENKQQNEEYICKYCKNLYNDVHQASCGCRSCKKCFDNR